MSERAIAARAMELTGKPDETLFSMLSVWRSPANAHLRTDPVTRQAVRRILRLRGYTFDKQTGQMLSGPSAAVVKRGDL